MKQLQIFFPIGALSLLYSWFLFALLNWLVFQFTVFLLLLLICDIFWDYYFYVCSMLILAKYHWHVAPNFEQFEHVSFLCVNNIILNQCGLFYLLFNVLFCICFSCQSKAICFHLFRFVLLYLLKSVCIQFLNSN